MSQEPTPAPETFDQQKEMQRQTELLAKINGKLAFMVWLIVLSEALVFLNALLS